jgi:magnesium transporter
MHGAVTWIDVENPAKEEVRELMEEFALDPLVAEELLAPSMRSRVEPMGNAIYMVLHFPAAKHSHTYSREQEVDFIVGERYIITTRYDTIDPLHNFSKVFEVNSLLDRENIGVHAGYVLYYMLTKLYRSLSHELDYLHNRLESAENSIFAGREKEMVTELSKIGRDLLNFKQSLGSHRDILISLDTAATALFGAAIGKAVRSVQGEYYRVNAAILTHTESLKELRETNTGLLYTKQNEIMKTLTIMAFVTFPLTLLAAVFGMNTEYTPLVGNPYDFWILTGTMFVGTVVFFAYFKYRGWL